MSPSFEPYLAAAGLKPEEARIRASSITGWGELRRWLDAHPRENLRRREKRVPIAPARIDMSISSALRRKFGLEPAVFEIVGQRGWEPVAAHRQRISLALTTLTAAALLLLTWFALRGQQMPTSVRVVYMLVYGAMTFFLASNFWKTMLGTLYLLRGPEGNPWHPRYSARDPDPEVRVAVLYPVYHEEVARVAAGIAACSQSLQRRRPELAHHFDFFLISDSRKPEYVVAERAAVHELRREFPRARFFYRWRQANANAKLGNVEDFCRRWGRDYRYMLVMDADSVMDGDALGDLLRMMEGNDRIGIIQTNPRPVLRQSLFGRMQQFAARLYGSVFTYSLMVMNMGNAAYIGHNAMLRLDAFIAHCILPELSGPKPWGGKPLSHDIVESAMMARRGYEVWFLPEIEGSYEEVPANILGFLERERRWMQGNLQHLRFLFLPGLRSIHRETFLNGSLGYIAAPLWAAFLVLSSWGMLHFLSNGLAALRDLASLRVPLLFLGASALIFLFLPRILAVGINIGSETAWKFGGKFKLAVSTVLETAFSLIFSPIIMIFVTRFVWLWIKRKGITWGAQARGDEPLGWEVCTRNFLWVSALGLVATGVLIHAVRSVPVNLGVLIEYMSGGWAKAHYLLFYLSPILFAFIASIWIVRYTSLTFPSLRRAGLFCIPEETEQPSVLAAVPRWERLFASRVPDPAHREATLNFAFTDPGFYVAHRADTRIRPNISRSIIPEIASGAPLDDKKLLLALSERRCFDLIHEHYAGSSGPASTSQV